MKLPPRTVFAAQTIATIFACFAQLGVLDWQIMNIPNFCSTDNEEKFYCVSVNNFFTSSIVWGALGPGRFVAYYKFLPMSFLAGAIFPVVIWLLHKKWGHTWVRYLHPVVLMYGGQLFAPVNFSMTWPNIPIAWFFMHYVKSRYLPWWSKYNYILTTALTSGIAFSAIVQFLALDIHTVSVSFLSETQLPQFLYSANGQNSLCSRHSLVPKMGWKYSIHYFV